MVDIDNGYKYEIIQIDDRQTAEIAYEIIKNKATNNAIMQGASGLFSILVTAAADVAAILTIYAPMWREIRDLYHLPPLPDGAVTAMITEILEEVMSDLVLDKIAGNIPLIGIYFNAICAKQMTWRLGMLFTVLSSLGADVTKVQSKEVMKLIRHLFPQKDMIMFVTPNKDRFLQLVLASNSVDVEEFNQKINDALRVFTSTSN